MRVHYYEGVIDKIIYDYKNGIILNYGLVQNENKFIIEFFRETEGKDEIAFVAENGAKLMYNEPKIISIKILFADKIDLWKLENIITKTIDEFY